MNNDERDQIARENEEKGKKVDLPVEEDYEDFKERMDYEVNAPHENFNITLSTPDGAMVTASIPEHDGSWSEIMKSFFGMLQTVGFVFGKENRGKFEQLIWGEESKDY